MGSVQKVLSRHLKGLDQAATVIGCSKMRNAEYRPTSKCSVLFCLMNSSLNLLVAVAVADQAAGIHGEKQTCKGIHFKKGNSVKWILSAVVTRVFGVFRVSEVEEF